MTRNLHIAAIVLILAYVLTFALLLVGCGDNSPLNLIKDDLNDSLTHSDMIEQVRKTKLLREQLEHFKLDSLSKYAQEVARYTSMREIDLVNKFEKVRDSLVLELKIEHDIIHELTKAPKDSIIFDTIRVTITDTIYHYDTVRIGKDRKGEFHVLKRQ